MSNIVRANFSAQVNAFSSSTERKRFGRVQRWSYSTIKQRHSTSRPANAGKEKCVKIGGMSAFSEGMPPRSVIAVQI